MIVHGRFLSAVLNHGKNTESEKDMQPLSSASAKKLGQVKNVQFLDVLIHSTKVKAQLLACIV